MERKENMKRITLKEIGKQLNLSPGTISKALNDSHEISSETKKMILAYTQKINYIPNFSAKSLKTGRSNTLAIIVPFISSSFFFDFYEEISLILSQTNYQLILLQTFNDEKKEKEALELCVQSNIDGIIISPVKNDSSLSLLMYIMEQICPIIIFDRINHQLDTFKIGIQNNKVIYQATEEMIKKMVAKTSFYCCAKTLEVIPAESKATKMHSSIAQFLITNKIL